MEDESRQLLKTHLVGFLKELKTVDPEVLELVAKWLREVTEGPPPPMAKEEGASVAPTAERRPPRRHNRFSINSRVGRFTKHRTEPFTAVEILTGMQAKGFGQGADTADKVRGVFKQNSNTYMCIDRGEDKWIRKNAALHAVA